MSKTTHNNAHAENSTTFSKHRLAQISHYFLSDGNERLPIWENTTIIPVLLGARNDDYIVYELNHAFNSQSSSMVLNIENRLAVSNHLSVLANNVTPTLTTHKDDDEVSLPAYCLIPVLSPSTTLALKSNRLLITVQASLNGVRIAYDQLAFIASLNTDFTICVIMLGAKTKPVARRFFSFLYNNTQSLLSLKLECSGYLLHGSDHADSKKTAEMEDGEIATDLNGIANNLLRQFTPGNKKVPTPHLAVPARPASRLGHKPGLIG